MSGAVEIPGEAADSGWWQGVPLDCATASLREPAAPLRMTEMWGREQPRWTSMRGRSRAASRFGEDIDRIHFTPPGLPENQHSVSVGT